MARESHYFGNKPLQSLAQDIIAAHALTIVCVGAPSALQLPGMSSRAAAGPMVEVLVALSAPSPPCPPDDGSVNCKALMLFIGVAVHIPF